MYAIKYQNNGLNYLDQEHSYLNKIKKSPTKNTAWLCFYIV